VLLFLPLLDSFWAVVAAWGAWMYKVSIDPREFSWFLFRCLNQEHKLGLGKN
jgi:hypothetical protein